MVFDTGCAHSITPVLDDFVTELEEHPSLTISGFTNADSVSPQGAGWVEWPIRDINGTTTVIRTRAYYVPQAGVRLFCPQNYDLEQDRQDEGVGHYSGTRTSIRFTDEYLHELEFPFTPNIRLPLVSLDKSIPETGLSETLLMNLS